MNRKRLGQLLIGGIFTVCASVIAALAELARSESEQRRADAAPNPEGQGEAPQEAQRNER